MEKNKSEKVAYIDPPGTIVDESLKPEVIEQAKQTKAI